MESERRRKQIDAFWYHHFARRGTLFETSETVNVQNQEAFYKLRVDTVVTQAVKHILGRGARIVAPHGVALQPAYLQTAISRSRHYTNAQGENPAYDTAQKLKHFVSSFIEGDTQDLFFMGCNGMPMDRRVYARSTRHKF